MKRIFVCLLAVLLMSSCTGGQTEILPETQIMEEETEAPLSKEEQILQSLPEKDYKGYSASYIQFLFKHLPDMTKYQVTVDEQTGESVNDAMHQVTAMVEERLNVSLSTVAYDNNDDMTKDLTTCINAGDDIYDAFFSHSAANFLRSGSLMNLSDISSFNFDNPWWNQGVMDSANLTEDVYLAYGSLSTTQYAFYVPTFFNKTLAENADLPDLYQIVRDGEWTLDKMDEMIEIVKQDVNGDGKMSIKDDILGYSTGMLTWTMYSAGAEIYSKNDSGVKEYNGISEKTVDIINRIAAIASDSNKYYASWSVSGVAQYHALMSNNLLFAQMHMMEAENLRDMESDYGILPNPKYTEEDDYISFLYNDCEPMTIPKTVSDPERAGVILENLCALTKLYADEVYINDMAERKLIRDEDSLEMIRLVYSSPTYFDYWNWEGVWNMLNDALKSSSPNIISAITSIEKALKAAIDADIATVIN
ncbi:MAG: hypothetical protein IJB52_09320 [Clostridia bacterium]|nr:hypothetical protein [Clostridia bacterium]